MPFPLAAVVPVIGGALGLVSGAAAAVGAAVATVSTTTLVIGGASLVVGGALAAAAISEANDEKYRKAKEEAERAASKEREAQLVKQAKKQKRDLAKLCESYGENMPEEVASNIMGEMMDTLGSLEGNTIGLEKKNEAPSAEAVAATEELKELRNGLTIKK